MGLLASVDHLLTSSTQAKGAEMMRVGKPCECIQ